MHNDPGQIFIKPVKDAIKTAILAAVPDFSDLDVRYNSIERDGIKGATILISPEIIPSVNRKDERTAAGRVESWRGADGNLWARHLRCTLAVVFDVRLWTQRLDATTRALLASVGGLPRHCYDGHLLTDPAAVDPSFTGNLVELSALSPEFPDDKTAVSKTYYAGFKVRAEGGIYVDSVVGVPVSTKIRPADPFFIQP